jgi:hypothetical protein
LLLPAPSSPPPCIIVLVNSGGAGITRRDRATTGFG